MAKTQKKARYMLIDGNALIHRGFHAIPPLHTKAGEQTNAVYGFAMILLRAISDLKPTHIACTFDLAAPTFRHEQYEHYKATRVKAAQELYDQIPRVKEVVRAFNIPIFEIEGFEADDVLGTLATHIHKDHPGDEVMIVTGDLDTLQLVNGDIKIYTLRKGITDIAVYDANAVRERYGLEPSQMIDFKALRGDPSDNIKGVKGIGEKGAIQLIQDFGGIDNLYKQIHAGKTGDKIKPKTLALLLDQEKEARLSYQLSKIVCDVPVSTDVPAYIFGAEQLKPAVAILQALEFHSLVAKLPKNYGGAELPDSAAPQAELATPAPVEPQAAHKKDYQFLNTEKLLSGFVKKLSKQRQFAIDTETTGIDPIQARLVGISFSFKSHTGAYVPAATAEKDKELRQLIESEDVAKVGHNIKYDLHTLKNGGYTLGGQWFDTMIASYLLNAGTRQHSLDTLAFNELGYQTQPIDDLIGKGKGQITMDLVDPAKVSWYASEDADVTWQLKELYEKRLGEEGLDRLFKEIEMPLVRVLADMERSGIILDSDMLKRLSTEAEKEIHALEKAIHKLAGREFNIGSPKQLKEILFDEMNLISVDNRKTKTGLSTAATELEKMADQHPIIAKILEYRELTKLQSTYLLALPELVNPATGRIHTSYNQTIAATGRLSSTDPNLQNIPVKGDGVGSQIRKAFVAPKGYTFLSLDYSQIELRIVAHLAQDKNMMAIFKNNEDVHTNTAEAIFGVKGDQVTKDMRRDAKVVNFGIIYGLSSFGLSSRIGEVSRSDAKAFIDKYFEEYPGVKAYMEQVKHEVRTDTQVKNELGRVRKFPEIRASNFQVRAGAERAAVNFPIQSLQADIIKIAMINIYDKLKDKSEEIKMLLQVHDELVFEVRNDMVETYASMLKGMMESAYKLSVPIVVEAKAGSSWGDMEKLKV